VPKLPTEKMTVLSTKYLSVTDRDRLKYLAEAHTTPSHLPRMETHEYGWLVFVNSDKDSHRYEDAGLYKGGFTEAFRLIFREAHDQGIHVINFDQDGEECDGLQEFEW